MIFNDPPIADKDKWLAFDYLESSHEADFWGLLNIRVSNENCGGNSERTEITFDTQHNGGNPMRLTVNVDEYGRGPVAHVTESSFFTITLYGQIEAGAFFDAMRKLVRAYDLRTKIGD